MSKTNTIYKYRAEKDHKCKIRQKKNMNTNMDSERRRYTHKYTATD